MKSTLSAYRLSQMGDVVVFALVVDGEEVSLAAGWDSGQKNYVDAEPEVCVPTRCNAHTSCAGLCSLRAHVSLPVQSVCASGCDPPPTCFIQHAREGGANAHGVEAHSCTIVECRGSTETQSTRQLCADSANGPGTVLCFSSTSIRLTLSHCRSTLLTLQPVRRVRPARPQLTCCTVHKSPQS